MNVEEMIANVRSQLAEHNEAALKDGRDILPALNRGQREAVLTMARYYPDPLLAFVDMETSPGQSTYKIPHEAFEERLHRVSYVRTGMSGEGTIHDPIKRLSYNQIDQYDTTRTSRSPLYYVIIGNEFRLLPSPSEAQRLRLIIVKDRPKLALPYGRITKINNASLILNSIENGPGTGVTDLSAFANVIDSLTGSVKGTIQMTSIQEAVRRISVAEVPTRTTVMGHTISSLADIDVQEDDYLSPIGTTCVLNMPETATNFILNWAKEDCQGTLGTEGDRMRKDFKKSLEDSSLNQEKTYRVRRVRRSGVLRNANFIRR